MTKNIFIILIVFTLTKITIACDVNDKSFDQDEVAAWLGSNSLFSKAYRNGKCVLDKALLNVSAEQRELIANLIAKSYAKDIKRTRKRTCINSYARISICATATHVHYNPQRITRMCITTSIK